MGPAELMVVFFLVFILILLPIYFIPSYIAFKKQKLQTTAIIVLNVFLGWTFLGWVVALVWACMEDGTGPTHEPQARVTETPTPNKLSMVLILFSFIVLLAVVIFLGYRLMTRRVVRRRTPPADWQERREEDLEKSIEESNNSPAVKEFFRKQLRDSQNAQGASLEGQERSGSLRKKQTVPLDD